MAFLKQLAQQLLQIYMGMSRPRRIGLLVLTAVCLAAIIGVGFYAAQPDYRPLYTGLAPEDAGAVAEKLHADGVPYKLAESGTTILVPAEQVHPLRLKLAAAGLPSSEKGYGLFDDTQIGVNPLAQQVNLNRAIQGELAKSIMQIEQVAHARVHIVMPDKTPFSRDRKPTTASVVLRLKPGKVLSRDSVAGIVALVARAVEGLLPENVTVIDTTGRILSEIKPDDEMRQPATQLEYRRELERYLSSRAQDMLAQILGPGRAGVVVAATVNFERRSSKRRVLDPEGKFLRRETTSSHKSAGDKPQGKGVAGAGSNLPTGSGAGRASAGNSKSETSEEKTEEWDTTETSEVREEATGTIERLTVAVTADLSAAEDGTAPTVSAADVENIVKQAVGFQDGRDRITVKDTRLAGVALFEGAEADYQQGQQWQRYLTLARYASLGMASLIAFLLGVLYLRSLFRAPPVTAPAPPEALADRLGRLTAEDPTLLAAALSTWLGPATSAAPTPVAPAALKAA